MGTARGGKKNTFSQSVGGTEIALRYVPSDGQSGGMFSWMDDYVISTDRKQRKVNFVSDD